MKVHSLHEVIHGTLQDHGELWEALANEGWNSTTAWSHKLMSKWPFVFINNAPEMVAASMDDGVGWDEVDYSYMEIPKGIKLT